MSLEILPIGGYGEVGRNCTAIKVDDELFLLDLGLHLESYVALQDDDDVKLTKSLLIKEKAVPDITLIDTKKVKAILISHAHLDHVGAIPYLSNTFDADIHGTPFTMAVAQKISEDKGAELRNKLVSHPYGEIFPLSEKVSAEFVEVTHSTPHTAAIVLHTSYGNVVYLNDFKLDDHPTIGNPTNLTRLAELHPKVLILDTLYADTDAHTPGELLADELLESALLSRDLTGKNIIVTTFSSQIARIHALVKIAHTLNRKVMIVGRSMAKYLEAAKDVGLSDVVDTHEVVKYGSRARKTLSKVDYSKDYLFIVTGGMAEPRAVLTRIVEEELLPLRRKDVVIFSNKVIPTPTIIPARERLEASLAAKGFEVLKDLHVSGHGSGKDMEIVLNTLKPEFVVPVHSEDDTRVHFAQLAVKCGIKKENVLILYNGDEYAF